MTAGRMTYDLRRLRLHGIIERVPHTHRYQVTPFGLKTAIFFTRTHNRLLRTGFAEICDPLPIRDPTTPRARPVGAHDHRSGGRPRPGCMKLDSSVPASPAKACLVLFRSIRSSPSTGRLPNPRRDGNALRLSREAGSLQGSGPSDGTRPSEPDCRPRGGLALRQGREALG